MNELLQKLLEAEVLSEETKKDLESAFNTHLGEVTKKAKEETEADVRAQLTEQWITERDALIEAVDSKVNDLLAKEINELKDDIEKFRDLEAEYAEKLVETKSQMADELKGDLKELIEKLDAFLEIRLNAEFEELREDITSVRKVDFGRRMFEAFVDEFTSNYADPDSAEGALRETTDKLDEAHKKVVELTKQLDTKNRTEKMGKVLKSLSGRQKEVMEAILANVATEQLEEAYKTFIGRVLKETTEPKEITTEKEAPVLAEGENNKVDNKVETVTMSGDDDTVLMETKKEGNKLPADVRARLRRMAGI